MMDARIRSVLPVAGVLAGMAAIAALVAFASLAWAQAPDSGDPARGKSLFDRRCTKCHVESTMGPPYTGLFGRRAGTVKGFPYSDALQKAGIDWGYETLDKWLTNPDAFVPGNLMGLRVRDPRERADIIAYLKTRN